MARGKNSPALFEVIRNAQQKQKEQLERQRHQQIIAETHAVSPAAALLRSPLYWFKGKQAHDAAVAGDAPVMREVPVTPAVPPVALSRTALRSAPSPMSLDEDDAFEAAAETVETVLVSAPPAAPKPLFDVQSPAAEAARQVREENARRSGEVAHAVQYSAFADSDDAEGPDLAYASAQEAPAAEPVFATAYAGSAYVADDDEPRTPSFAAMPMSGPAAPTAAVGAGFPLLPFNYTTAIIGTFAVIVAGVSLYVVTTAGRGVPTAKAGPPAVRSDARPEPRPDVLDVANKPAPTDPDAATADDDSRANLNSAGETMTLETIGRPIAVPTNLKRIVGHQYLVLLSFPADDDAKEFVKFLAQNGVPATAEKALPDYAKSWTSVVSARGFDHTKKNPAYDAYVATLEDLLQKYAGDSKFRKTFKIDKYTWRTAR